MRTLKTNIYNLYLIKLSKWFMLIMPVVALYYTENGLEIFDIYLLQAVYSVSVAILEIPSGYMADIIGRRTSMIAGGILGTLGFAIYSFSSGLPGFLFAEVTLGLGGSFISGADSALLYDSLVGLKQRHKYLQLEGRITSLGNFAETTAAIGGGLIAAYFSYRSVYIAQTAVAAMAIPAALLLVEPPKKKIIARPGMGHILRVCRDSLFINKKLSSTLVMSAVTGTATLCMAWTSQVYFVSMGLTERWITPLWVGLNLIVAIFSALAKNVVDILGTTRALVIITTLVPLSYCFLGLFPLWGAIAVLMVFYGIRGYATPLLKDMVNRNCQSEVRATVLSVRNMLIRVCFSLLGPLIGVLSSRYSLRSSLIIAGFLLLALSCSTLWFYMMVRRKEVRESGGTF